MYFNISQFDSFAQLFVTHIVSYRQSCEPLSTIYQHKVDEIRDGRETLSYVLLLHTPQDICSTLQFVSWGCCSNSLPPCDCPLPSHFKTGAADFQHPLSQSRRKAVFHLAAIESLAVLLIRELMRCLPPPLSTITDNHTLNR